MQRKNAATHFNCETFAVFGIWLTIIYSYFRNPFIRHIKNNWMFYFYFLRKYWIDSIEWTDSKYLYLQNSLYYCYRFSCNWNQNDWNVQVEMRVEWEAYFNHAADIFPRPIRFDSIQCNCIVCCHCNKTNLREIKWKELNGISFDVIIARK